jgi:hypothetical protein
MLHLAENFAQTIYGVVAGVYPATPSRFVAFQAEIPGPERQPSGADTASENRTPSQPFLTKSNTC